MVRRDGAAVRRERIQEVGRIIHKTLFEGKGEVPLKKTIALLQYETGLTPEKIMVYLEILQDMGQFEVDKEQGTVKRVEV